MSDTPRTLPPDPSVPGLWWLCIGNMCTVMAWRPSILAWCDTDGGRCDPIGAHAAGWRCVKPAVPPEIPSDAAKPQSTPR